MFGNEMYQFQIIRVIPSFRSHKDLFNVLIPEATLSNRMFMPRPTTNSFVFPTSFANYLLTLYHKRSFNLVS